MSYNIVRLTHITNIPTIGMVIVLQM